MRRQAATFHLQLNYPQPLLPVRPPKVLDWWVSGCALAGDCVRATRGIRKGKKREKERWSGIRQKEHSSDRDVLTARVSLFDDGPHVSINDSILSPESPSQSSVNSGLML